ncbi:putative C6 transcription factor [Phyllosticta citricarpa]
MDGYVHPPPMAQPAAAAPPPVPAYSSTAGTRQRIITSCLTCRRRKVKCDHKYPICSACSRGNHVCYYANIPNQQSGRSPPNSSSNATSNRVSKHAAPHPRGAQSSHAEINARLERLESLLERAVSQPAYPPVATRQPSRREPIKSEVVESKETAENSASPKSSTSSDQILAADAYDGTLLVENGQSHFVSSLHWALLTDELQDIKAILSNEQHRGNPEEPCEPRIRTSQSLLFSSGQASRDPSEYMPNTPEECFELFGIFIQNVDPVSRLVHKPSLSRRFSYFIRTWANMSPAASGRADDSDPWTEEQIHHFEPLAFAIFYSSINSLRPEAVTNRFRKDKQSLLMRYHQGLELSLQQVDFLTTSSLEVLQAFVLQLTCQVREDDMGPVWPLTGIAIRIAMLQGLHREPTLFANSSMDEVQMEIRRRVWHQICHMDWRAAEGKGMEPTVSDDDFTTMLPRNVNDTDLVEGRMPPSDPHMEEQGFTDMTLQLCRLSMIKCFRRIAQNVYHLDRKVKASKIKDGETCDIVQEFQDLFEETKRLVDEVHDKNERCYLRYCRVDITIQRLTIGLTANLEWRCWLIFWYGVPREFRHLVITDEIRTQVLTRSISLIESLNTVSSDKDAEHFQWHIGGHAAFQSIMHVLSELRDPQFPAANDSNIRCRALRALHTVYAVKGRTDSNTWAVIRRMIDRLDPKHESAKMSTMGGFSEKRFGEHDLSVIYFAKSPSPSTIPTPQPQTVPLPSRPNPQQMNMAQTRPPVTMSQQDYVLYPSANGPPMVSTMGNGDTIEARYAANGPGLSAGLSEIERLTSSGLGDINTNAWLQDMAMDMDWGFWNFDPLQFDSGFGQYAAGNGQGQ